MASLTRRREAGFSLVQAMVALAILLLFFFALSVALISESGRRLERSGERHRDTVLGLTLERLRADAHGSQGFGTMPGYDPYALWQDVPLAIVGHWSGGSIVYALDPDTGEVVRLQGGSQSTLAKRVTAFRWRFLDDVPRRVVELEITYRTTDPHRGTQASRGAGADVERTTRLVLFPRRRSGATWW